jgi:hypothetical protein
MEYCSACGSPMERDHCPGCDRYFGRSDSSIERAARLTTKPQVFLVEVCNVCNGVTEISCTCERSDSARDARTEDVWSRLKEFVRRFTGGG